MKPHQEEEEKLNTPGNAATRQGIISNHKIS